MKALEDATGRPVDVIDLDRRPDPDAFVRSGIKSAGDKPSASAGAPKSSSASRTRRAFSGSGRIQTSRSPVARGTPCAARACAPTTRNRVLARTRAASRSRKSGFTVRAPRPAHDAHRDPLPRVGGEEPAGGGPGVDREWPHRCNAVFGRRVAAQVVAGLFAQSKHPDRPRSARAPSRLCGAWMRHRVRSYRSCRRAMRRDGGGRGPKLVNGSSLEVLKTLPDAAFARRACERRQRASCARTRSR